MKVINKILCFLSLLVLCVPLLCFNVSAGSGVGNVLKDTVLDNKLPFTESDMSSYLSKSENSSLASSIKYDNADGSALIGYNSGFNYHPYSGKFYYYPFDEIYNSTYLFKAYTLEQSLIDADNLYYIAFSYYPNKKEFLQIIIYSTSQIYLKDYGSYISYSSDSDLYYSVYKTTLDTNSNSYFVPFGVSYASGTILNCLNFKSNPPIQYSNTSSDLKNFSFRNDNRSSTKQLSMMSVYCNFNLDTSLLPNVTPQKFDKLSVNGQEAPLSDFIDVKLTPEFGLDMDRIDPLRNQSDYFKLEITNNSDSAIQWCAGIYDPELVTADTMNISSLSSWAYVCRTTYYDFSVKEDKGIFRTTYTYSGALKTGSFDYHHLEPGETFSDLIFWENIKINPNVIYHFFVNAVKTDLKYATTNIDPPVTEDSSDLHSVTVIEDTYYDTILEGAADFTKLDCNIFNIEFSCLSMPDFTTTVRGGNSILNTSGNDRYQLLKNYESVSDINGLDTKINKDFTDPAILANTFNRSDVSVDIDSFSVDDVKSYITSCQSFFILIKEALLSFPAFIWALICFGLTGLIVIGIVKAIL